MNTKITESIDTLLDVKIPPQPVTSITRYFLSNNSLKEAFRKIFEPKAVYTFLRTTVNPDAHDLVEKNNKELAKLRRITHDDYHFSFDADLMDVYLRALEHLTKEQHIQSISFPLIQNEGVHQLDRNCEQAFWPVIHVIKGKTNVPKFENTVANLNHDEAYDCIKRQQAPQNYRMPEINLIRNNKIAPLTIQKRTWIVEGSILRNAVDFLCQCRYVGESTQSSIYDD